MATENALALARAVLAGNEAAVAGLVDEVQAEMDLRRAKEWLALWDGFAMAYLSGPRATSPRKFESQYAYHEADALMAARAKRLREMAGEGTP
jgi:hypothetical protein